MSRKALRCPMRGRDANAGCDDMGRLMVRLALRLYAKGKVCIQSVYFYPIRTN